MEAGTSPEGVHKLTSDLKLFKSDLDKCLREFYQMLELLGSVVDKYEVLRSEFTAVSDQVSGLEKRKSAALKTQPDSVEEWKQQCQLLKVGNSNRCEYLPKSANPAYCGIPNEVSSMIS